MRIDTTTPISAPPELVWRVLNDFAGYEAWNPLAVNAVTTDRRVIRLMLDLDPEDRYLPATAILTPCRQAMTLRAQIQCHIPLFIQTHYSACVDAAPAGAVLRESLHITGPLRSLYLKQTLRAKIARKLTDMTAALKQLCERESDKSRATRSALV